MGRNFGQNAGLPDVEYLETLTVNTVHVGRSLTLGLCARGDDVVGADWPTKRAGWWEEHLHW